MSANMSAELLKLSINPCTVSNDGVTVDESKTFAVMLNPVSYSHEHSIGYNTEGALGNAGHNQKFNVYKPEKLSFEITLDGTGVVAPLKNGSGGGSEAGSVGDVKTQIGELKDIVYKYDGSKHRPNNVRVVWGSLVFIGCLDKLAISYTLFKPTGEPLRAKIKISFLSAVSQAEEARATNKTSPDLTHLVEVKAGDTLPLLCHRIYKNSAYYLDIARLNGITNFRKIQPGTRLNFPPLR